MLNYYISFPDNSIYIGATKGLLENRIKNHISKHKSGKYKDRKLYKKMTEFSLNYKYGTLSISKTEDEMYEKEIGFISLFNGKGLLNNSTGGKCPSKGRKSSIDTIKKMIESKESKNPIFEVYCKKTKNLLYRGRSLRECSILLKMSYTGVWDGIRRAKKGLMSGNNTKYLYFVPEVGYPDSV